MSTSNAQEMLQQRLADYAERGVRQVRLALTDIDGVLRGKYVSLQKFGNLLTDGGGFCDCILGWDVADELYSAGEFTGWHTGFPDARYRLIADSERWSASDNVPFFLGEFTTASSSSSSSSSSAASSSVADVAEHPICPRSLLRRVLQTAQEQGSQVKGGFEYEFFVFDETAHSIREKSYRNLKPVTPGNFGYSYLRAATQNELFTQLMDYCQDMSLDIEGLHCETGPGVWEAALAATEGVEIADRANLFKTHSKIFFAQRELLATFMAKWSMDYPGQSGHFHFSLLDASGANQFSSAQDLPATMRHALGGLQRLLPQWLVMLAPTVNSYTRLVRGAWAPTAATWGVDNRTAALRVIPGGSSQRIEVRIGGADANPYLVAAAVVAAAQIGIRDALEPTEPVRGNAYELDAQLPEQLRFPSTLGEAAARFAASGEAAECFGSDFVRHYALSRQFEQSEHTRHVDSWQLDRYLEII